MPSRPRIEYLDLAKGFCIFLVALFHATTYFPIEMPAAHAFSSMRLPLYFFLSGCFFKPYNGWLDFLKRKTNKLLIPFVFWFIVTNILIIYLYSLLNIHVFYSQPVGIWHEVVRFIQKGKFFNIPIWFLLCLFEINILFYLIYALTKKLFKRHQTLIICLLSLLLGVVGLVLYRTDNNIPFFFDSALYKLPFFAFGYVCFRHTAILKPNPSDKFIPLFIVVLSLFLYFFAPHDTCKTIQTYLLHLICGFSGTLLVVFLSKWIKYIPVIRWWGRYSIIILITHLVFMKHFVYIVRRFHLFPDQPWTATLIILGLTMLCCSAAIPICKRFFPHVTAQKDLIPISSEKNNTPSQECPQNQE